MHATTQTASGLVSGTPAYISPEQAQGLKVDHRTDIYSLSVILYEILAGKVPFEAESTWSQIYKHIHEAPPPIPNVQPAVQKVIDRALAKKPDDRYQTCRDLTVDYMNAIGLIAEASTMPFVSGPVPTSTDQARQTPLPASQPATPGSTPPRRNMIPFFGVGIAVLALAIFGVSRLFGAAPVKSMPTPTPIRHG